MQKFRLMMAVSIVLSWVAGAEVAWSAMTVSEARVAFGKLRVTGTSPTATSVALDGAYSTNINNYKPNLRFQPGVSPH